VLAKRFPFCLETGRFRPGERLKSLSRKYPLLREGEIEDQRGQNGPFEEQVLACLATRTPTTTYEGNKILPYREGGPERCD